MLTKFSVKNYKQFKEEITFDLTAGNYSFNEECVNDKTVKTALIYGANGTGKTNLGWAIFDLVEHLTDNSATTNDRNTYFVNALLPDNLVEFSFEFNLLNSTVVYKYKKNSSRKILSEDLYIDGKVIIQYEHGKPFTSSLQGTKHLNKELNNNQNISVLSYILHNSNLDTNDLNSAVFISLMHFVNNMTWLQSTSYGMSHIGNAPNYEIDSKIVEDGLEKFEAFLNNNGIDCKLKTIYLYGKTSIGVDFDGNFLPLYEIASTGTKQLLFLYVWFIETQLRRASLLFIDEFDASYHFKLSQNIVNKLKELEQTQIILTTHNTNLLSNDLIRPDCGFIINGKKIKALHKCTEKELREAHNLEKLYKAGAFNV